MSLCLLPMQWDLQRPLFMTQNNSCQCNWCCLIKWTLQINPNQVDPRRQILASCTAVIGFLLVWKNWMNFICQVVILIISFLLDNLICNAVEIFLTECFIERLIKLIKRLNWLWVIFINISDVIWLCGCFGLFCQRDSRAFSGSLNSTEISHVMHYYLHFAFIQRISTSPVLIFLGSAVFCWQQTPWTTSNHCSHIPAINNWLPLQKYRLITGSKVTLLFI